jgi:hypothetical protein
MLLKDKNAVIYGAAGAIGSAVARKFPFRAVRGPWPRIATYIGGPLVEDCSRARNDCHLPSMT